MKELLNRILAKRDCILNGSVSDSCHWLGPLKYYVYSAVDPAPFTPGTWDGEEWWLLQHDSTVMRVMQAMGTGHYMERGMPDYTGAILWELWRADNGSFYIHVPTPLVLSFSPQSVRTADAVPEWV